MYRRPLPPKKKKNLGESLSPIFVLIMGGYICTQATINPLTDGYFTFLFIQQCHWTIDLVMGYLLIRHNSG